MPIKYRKAASERKPEDSKRTVKRYPELRLAAEIAGVSYWMAYGVLRGRAQSKKVELALQMARTQLHARALEEKKLARQKLRELQSEQKRIKRQQQKIELLLGKRKAA